MQVNIFNPETTYNTEWYIFKNSTELGQIYKSIPWQPLVNLLPEKKKKKNKSSGTPSWFNRHGILALMFLKHYTGLSDEKLVERINTDYAFQLFCGIRLSVTEQIKDLSIVSRARCFLAKHLNREAFQSVLAEHWKSDLDHTHMVLMDATCYESYIRYPTDIKLLWECCEWVFEHQIWKLCEQYGQKRPRSKYKEQKDKQLQYSRLRKKSHKQGQKRKKALLYLLNKGINQLQELLNKHVKEKQPSKFYATFKLIKKIYGQQYYLFTTPQGQLSDRVVSLHKPYLRPIVRGKENKPVEFGAKVHVVQVGGLNFIEHLSWKAFNECKRLKISVLKHKKIFVECSQLGADAIYATNENRRFVSKNSIFTNFKGKGRAKRSKQEKALSSIIGKERATRLEGSFGNEKNNYGLRKIKARKESTEEVWILFGMMTANAVKISKTRTNKEIISLKSAA